MGLGCGEAVLGLFRCSALGLGCVVVVLGLFEGQCFGAGMWGEAVLGLLGGSALGLGYGKAILGLFVWGSILGLKGPGLNLATWGLRYGAQWRPLGTCPL